MLRCFNHLSFTMLHTASSRICVLYFSIQTSYSFVSLECHISQCFGVTSSASHIPFNQRRKARCFALRDRARSTRSMLRRGCCRLLCRSAMPTWRDPRWWSPGSLFAQKRSPRYVLFSDVFIFYSSFVAQRTWNIHFEIRETARPYGSIVHFDFWETLRTDMHPKHTMANIHPLIFVLTFLNSVLCWHRLCTLHLRW